jgi:dihydroneopterin aldolase
MTVSDMGDRIRLRGIEGIGRHGVFDFERENGQPFLVDLDLIVDLAPAGSTDVLADTVDYGTLVDRVLAEIEGEPRNLIESLAERIAGLCLEDTRVERAVVTVHKPKAPVAGNVADVAVSIDRSRP